MLRRDRHPRWVVWAVATVAVALTALVAVVVIRERDPETTSLRHCTVSRHLVPTCGALWGISTKHASTSALQRAQRLADRRFDLVYRFHDINDEIPDAQERALVAGGTILHISIDPRDFALQDRTTVKWAAVADGHYDAELKRQAAGIASLHAPVFVTFDHEMDQPVKAALGSPADFRAAWRHVHELFRSAGATNVLWVWVALGWPGTFHRAASLWPGNRYVDWISWDVYNASGCRIGNINPYLYKTFREEMLPFYRWLHEHGAAYGIDASKPMMISEAGATQYPGGAALTAEWYADIPKTLRRYPQIKAVTLWSGTGNGVCDYRITDNKRIAAAVRRAGRDTWLAVDVKSANGAHSAHALR